jgi:mitochondrial fission protein ELM1
MNRSTPRIWVLTGERTGDNNQVLALAEELGLPFEIRTLRYARIGSYDVGRINPRLFWATTMSLTRESRAQIRPPWPDLVIGIGRRSIPVVRYIRRKNGKQTKLVWVGHPRVDPELFDLVITTRQYPVPRVGNTLLLPMAMSRFRDPPVANESERAWLDAMPRPRLLFAIGGATKYWELQPHLMAEAAARIAARARALGGSLTVTGSRRTDSAVLDAIAPVLGDAGRFADASGPRFAVLLDDADEVFVTADSVSMLSEAIIARKPVGMVPVTLNALGLKCIGDSNDPQQKRKSRRDLRRFWEHLREAGLVGTIDEPRTSPTDNPVELAAKAVRELLGR